MLRLITPQETCRNLDVYPVRLTQDAILIDVEGAANTRFQARARAGARRRVCALSARSHACAARAAVQGRAVLADSDQGAKHAGDDGRGSGLRQTTRGGSDTSIDSNNVFAVQPRMYLESAPWDAA